MYSRYIVNLHCTVYVWDTCAVHALLAGLQEGLYSRYIVNLHFTVYVRDSCAVHALLAGLEEGLYSRYIVNLHCTVYVWDTCAVHALLAGVGGGVVSFQTFQVKYLKIFRTFCNSLNINFKYEHVIGLFRLSFSDKTFVLL